jgi:hypothetical protein
MAAEVGSSEQWKPEANPWLIAATVAWLPSWRFSIPRLQMWRSRKATTKRTFHPGREARYTPPCVASWDRRRQDCFRFADANLLQRAMDCWMPVCNRLRDMSCFLFLQNDDNCHVDGAVWFSVPVATRLERTGIRRTLAEPFE